MSGYSSERIWLGTFPTPLEPAPRLAAVVGLHDDRLWIKRDDLTGLGGGVRLAEQPRDRDGGCDQKRLGDGGIGDLFRAAGRAELDQVPASQLRPGAELLGQTRYLEPGGQESGGLRALPWRSEDEHIVNLAL